MIIPWTIQPIGQTPTAHEKRMEALQSYLREKHSYTTSIKVVVKAKKNR